MQPHKNSKIMTNSNEKQNTNYSVKISTNDYRDTEINLNHYKGFKVVYLSPTNHKGIRISITDLRSKKKVVISRGSEDNYRDEAIKYITQELGATVKGFVSDEVLGFYLILINDFDKGIFNK
tara:strand:- start:28 stop:393 length:366 start_codon:yes stop_codon:yes gene_type:complete